MLLCASRIDVWQRDLVGAKRQEHLTDALHLGESGKDQPNRLAHAQVRILFYLVAAYFHIAHGHREKELTPPSLLLQGFHGTSAEERQFQFAHRPLHAQQQPIVAMPRLIDTIFIDNHRPN